MKLGIAGKGMIGGNLGKYLVTLGHEVSYSDPPQGIEESFSGVEAVFICVPVPPADAEAGAQDLTAVLDVIRKFRNLNKPFFMRSTVLPGTCDGLMARMNIRVHSMPEFLTARVAYDDVVKHNIIVGMFDGANPAEVGALVHDMIFQGRKDVHFCKNAEAESAKMFHNIHGAMDVTVANYFEQVARRLKLDYRQIRWLANAITGNVTMKYSSVPGPDGLRGYGGACFPGNMAALQAWFEMNAMTGSRTLESAIKDNALFRRITPAKRRVQE